MEIKTSYSATPENVEIINKTIDDLLQQDSPEVPYQIRQILQEVNGKLWSQIKDSDTKFAQMETIFSIDEFRWNKEIFSPEQIQAEIQRAASHIIEQEEAKKVEHSVEIDTPPAEFFEKNTPDPIAA